MFLTEILRVWFTEISMDISTNCQYWRTFLNFILTLFFFIFFLFVVRILFLLSYLMPKISLKRLWSRNLLPIYLSLLKKILAVSIYLDSTHLANYSHLCFCRYRCNILRRVPNSALWLLRFPAAGETRLRNCMDIL